ncbi:MAG: MMPL family transporter, partial [archaeon]|nr:MMPL family transporter [archaeon]
PSLGENFYQTGILVSAIAIILVIIVIFLFFREVIPSGAILLAIIFDIAGALGLMSIFGIPLSLATIPALVMLIGYSVDTDVMLTTRVLKRKEGTPRERAHESMITGLTMTLTTLAALTVMIILSYFSQLEVVFQIAAVLLFGLCADLISTWLMNAPILLWYVEKKEGKKVERTH